MVIEDSADVVTPTMIFLVGLLIGRSHGNLTIQKLIPLMAEIK